jgi:hypothetical protein
MVPFKRRQLNLFPDLSVILNGIYNSGSQQLQDLGQVEMNNKFRGQYKLAIT